MGRQWPNRKGGLGVSGTAERLAGKSACSRALWFAEGAMMFRFSKAILGLSFSLTVVLSLASAQNKNEILSSNASLRETIDWLKSHIAYSYVVPMNRERTVLQREAIGHFQASGCTVTYEVTTGTLTVGSTNAGEAPSGFTQERWRINLDGLNPEVILVEPAKGDRPARLTFTSFDPHDPNLLKKIDPAKPYIAPIEPGKVIWHSTRLDDMPDRNGEGFVNRSSFSVRDEAKGQAIADALRHAIRLCRQIKRA